MSESNTGKTFYTDRKKYPKAAQHEDEEDTYLAEEVLGATDDFLPFFDVFGSMLKLCKNDLVGNVTKLRKKLGEYPNVKTFRQLLKYEVDNKLHKKSDSASIAALWYKRGLQFSIAFMDAISEPDIDTMHKAYEKAYAATLKKYHNWILQKTLNAVAYALPYKHVAMNKLCYGDDSLLQQCFEEQGVYSSSAKPVAVYLHNLIIDLGLDNEDKIEDVPPH